MRSKRRIFLFTLIAAMVLSGAVPFDAAKIFGSATAQAAVTLHNPTYDADTDMAQWDCVWFGNYWQSDTNGDGVADKNDARKPIKWRVLSVDGDDVFLLADKNLDVKSYNETDKKVTWETCTLRSWLNGYGSTSNVCGTDYTTDNFIDAAFNTTEQAAIKTTKVVNTNNPYFDTKGGNTTMDKLYLLSIAEVSNSAYGFKRKFESDSDTRLALNTAYVANYNGTMSAVGWADWWWLRSPGRSSRYAAHVDPHGYGNYNDASVLNSNNAVRPALHLSLSSSPPLTYVGMVCSDGTETDAEGNVLAPAPGQIVKDTASKAFYQIVYTGTKNITVMYICPIIKTKKVTVPDTISFAGKKYKVTVIAKNAFAGNEKLKTLVIGKNVKTIRKKAFKNCKNLRQITVKSKVLTNVGRNAFKGTNKKLTVKVPKNKKAKYQKLFKGKGNKKIKIK